MLQILLKMQSLEYNLILKLLFILLCINNSSLIAQPSPCNMSIIVIDGVDTIKFTKQNNNNQSFYFCFRFYNDTICEQVYSKIIYGPDRDAVAGQINDKYYYNIVISFQIPPPDFKLIIYHNSKKMTIDLLNSDFLT